MEFVYLPVPSKKIVPTTTHPPCPFPPFQDGS